LRTAINVDDLLEFDPAKYLDNEESPAVDLTGILEANDAALLASALGDIAPARGMTEIARAAGITREALLQSPSPRQRAAFRHHQPRLHSPRRAFSRPTHPNPPCSRVKSGLGLTTHK